VLLSRINAPVEEVQISPLTGDVGADPERIRRLETVVVEPATIKFVVADGAVLNPTVPFRVFAPVNVLSNPRIEFPLMPWIPWIPWIP
jgi:hypothetical protein